MSGGSWGGRAMDGEGAVLEAKEAGCLTAVTQQRARVAVESERALSTVGRGVARAQRARAARSPRSASLQSRQVRRIRARLE